MRLLLATNNRDKAAEIRAILSGLDVGLVLPADIALKVEVEEDADTFEGNAAKKACAFAAAAGMEALADDSGLAVEALGGRPGVFSARYAGPGCAYADNNRKLLAEMAALPPERREARMVCVAAVATPRGLLLTVRGECRGRIALAPRGTNGFGYDPVFVPEGQTRAFAEMAPHEKAAISHRGRALRALRAALVERGFSSRSAR
ncbi:MAG: RdgB/HAM1 family non-canonical purine NTP pyrophosphatase [Planctomycetes bacterium]|nr:RdgB/HAM1 family non-canonical purine NTP pyrophosphatase [Planctomycetota bacterium]